MPGRPDILGYIPQRFKVYRGAITAAQSTYIAKIERHIGSDVVSPLRSVDAQLASGTVAQLKLGMIKDFGVLAAPSQEEGVAIADVHAGNPAQRAEARQAFEDIAKKIISRLKTK